MVKTQVWCISKKKFASCRQPVFMPSPCLPVRLVHPSHIHIFFVSGRPTVFYFAMRNLTCVMQLSLQFLCISRISSPRDHSDLSFRISSTSSFHFCFVSHHFFAFIFLHFLYSLCNRIIHRVPSLQIYSILY